jgi:hypothetical protein
MLKIKIVLIVYAVLCVLDSFVLRNLKKKALYRNAVSHAYEHAKKLVVVGSPSLDLVEGGLISFVTEKTFGPSYGCGDVCVDITGCPKCEVSYTGDILDFLRGQDPGSCVLFSTGVLEFTDNYEEIRGEIERTCVRNYTDYYSPWNVTWFTYGCSTACSTASGACGLLKGFPRRFFWTNPFDMSGAL